MSSVTVGTEANVAVQSLIEGLVKDGRERGVQVAAWLGESQIVDCWAGIADPTTSRPVDGDTLFNVFSVSKAVVATSVHILAERGLVDYDAPVADYWPDFAAAGKGTITVRQVLSHVSGALLMPPEVTPELMCDWDWITGRIAEMPGKYPPGERSSYQAMTFGWILGEVVRRADDRQRTIRDFVCEEIGDRIGAPDLWLGMPESEAARVAKLDGSVLQVAPEGTLTREAAPIQVDLTPEVVGRPDVQHASIPSVGGIFTARSQARFWAMLANGGTFAGQRILAKSTVAGLAAPRPHFEDADPVFFGMVVPIAWSGFWLGGDNPPVSAPRTQHALCHPGAGGSLGWADLDSGLAVAFCRSRMYDATDVKEDSATLVGDAIRATIT